MLPAAKAVISFLLASCRSATPAALDNAADFAALCGAYNLYAAREKLQQVPAFPPAAELLAETNNLNITTSSDSWFTNKDGTIKKADGTVDADETATWAKQNAELVKNPITGEHLYKRLPDGDGRRKANRLIKALLSSAKQLTTEYQAAVDAITKHRQKAQQKIQAAIFGADKSDFDKTRYTTARSRGKLCGDDNAGTDAANAPLVYAFICLCRGREGAAQSECANGITDTVSDAGSQESQAADAWRKIKAACESHRQYSLLTPNTITSAVATILGRIGALNSETTTPSNDKFTLGKTSSSKCDGTAGSKQCINYKKKLGTKSGKISWLDDLTEAAHELAEADRQQAAAENLKASTLSINRHAWDVYTSAAYDAEDPSQVLPPERSGPAKLTKEEDCNKHQSSEKCTAPCKWNENVTDPNKKCSLDSAKAAEQQATQTNTAGTGEGAARAAAATGCTKYETKNFCEEDKTGDKQICAFRKGKDNEPEKDKEMCRNGSFLGNKKFALGVAALVGFVEF
uniref:Variant surface glycoprotein 1125.203 n=1 Tax=Trypanosoma brucei TaxID=5691 RepID=A0A1J0R5E0_9TRYP|nr:variant surface glycoprotein 1125.203 [Trypanosoma brucei]